MRLINALASDYYGRTYLVSNDKTVVRLIGILMYEVPKNIICSFFKYFKNFSVFFQENRLLGPEKHLGFLAKTIAQKETANCNDRKRIDQLDSQHSEIGTSLESILSTNLIDML